MGKVTDGKWWADGLEVGAGAIMDVKIAKVSGSDYDEAKANAKLIAQAKELREALEWALPLAEIAVDTHRMYRIQCGHTDINGTYSDGQTWVGIYQNEVDKIEHARRTLKLAKGE